MSRLWRRLRFRLAAALAVSALVPLLLMGAITLELASRSLEQSVIRRHEAVLDAFTGSLELFHAHQIADLEALARHPAVQSLDPLRYEPILNDFRTAGTFFERLEVTDLRPAARAPAGGKPEAHAPPSVHPSTALASSLRSGRTDTEGSAMQSPGPNTAIGERTDGGGSAIRSSGPSTAIAEVSGPIARAVQHGRTVIAAGQGGAGQLFAVPIPGFADRGRPPGVLTARAQFDSTDIQEILDTFPARRDRWIAVIDRLGRILASKGLDPGARSVELPSSALGASDRMAAPSVHPSTSSGRTDREGAATQSSGPSRATVERTRTLEAENAGEIDILSVSALPSTGGWLVSGQSKVEAFRFVKTLSENFATILLVALALVVAASILLSKAISEPITALAAGIGKLEAGVLSHRLEPQSDDEIGEAGRAYNALAETLQRRTLIASIWKELEEGAPLDEPGEPPA